MPHNTKIIGYTGGQCACGKCPGIHPALNNGQHAILVECCGDPLQREWHTLASHIASNPDKLKESMDRIHKSAAFKHEHHSKGDSNIAEYHGKEVKHHAPRKPEVIPAKKKKK